MKSVRQSRERSLDSAQNRGKLTTCHFTGFPSLTELVFCSIAEEFTLALTDSLVSLVVPRPLPTIWSAIVLKVCTSRLP